MDESIYSRPTGSSNTVASVRDLGRDIDKCTAWLATRDSHITTTFIKNVFVQAINAGRSDICQLIFDSGRLDYTEITSMSQEAIAIACYGGHLSVAQLLVSRWHPSTKRLYMALTHACTHGHIVIVTWLLNEMKLSHDLRVRWLLATACAHGDINTVRQLAVQAGVSSTEAMSQALRVACYKGRVKVVDWLMTHTTADVSLCGELDNATGSMTSLTAACRNGHVDTVVTLLKCVTPHTVNIQCGKYNDSALHFDICFSKVENWIHSLHMACTKANIDDVSIMMYDTDVSTTDHQGCTPLHLVCQNGSVNIVQLLLSVFARVDITNNDRNTPIDTANRYGNKKLVPYMSPLLDVTNYTPSSSAGADVRATNGVTRPAVDVIVSDVSIAASDVRSTAQPCTQCNTTTHTPQQQRQSVKVATSSNKSRPKIV
jgi:ankyrin repeat protein